MKREANKFSMISAAVFAAALAGASASAFAASSYDTELAGFHQKNGQTCQSCHANGMEVSDSETEINKQCVSCHGPLEKLASGKKPDPHASHLGTIQCTTCHSGHAPSQSYCLSCHDFDMKIPFGAQKKTSFSWKDLASYKDAAPVRTEMADIVIVGSGAAGFTAAMEAHARGVKNIVILEKMPIPGGNSQLAAGGMNAAGSVYQKAKGIQDSPELMAKDTMKGGKNISNPDLVKIFAEDSAESIQWLKDRGAELENVAQGGGASAPRMHGPKGGKAVGPYLSAFFRKEIEKLPGVDLRLNSRLVKLITGPDGSVTGVLVEGKHSGIYQINAKAVVLATGGLGANKELVHKYLPKLDPATKTSNQPGTTGDGMYLAEQAGAALVDMKEIQLNPTLLVGSPVIISETVRGQGAIFVNREGKRFISELTTRDVTSAAVSKQTGGTAFEIFDDGTRSRVAQLQACFELGLVKEGNSPQELGKAAGIDGEALAATIKRFNGSSVAMRR